MAGLVLLAVTAGALAATGDLSQPGGMAGCIDHFGNPPCADGHALKSPYDVTASPDGKSVYVTSLGSGAVARLNRSPTGAITQPAGTAGCISDTGAGPCANGHGLAKPLGVAVSPDGKSVYAAASAGGAVGQVRGAVARLVRNPTTGAISQPPGATGCISETGADACANGHGLSLTFWVAVSPDGKSVYATSAGGVARFNRNTATGAISQPAGPAGCISETGSGPCADGHALNGPQVVAVSPDGKSVYVASAGSDAVARLVRNPTTGAITQPAGAAGCISETGAGPCADGHGLDRPYGVAVSPDGKSLYVAGAESDAVARFTRNTTTGAITQPAGVAGCISEDGAGPCANGHALHFPTDVEVSPDGRSVYLSARSSHAVVRLTRYPSTGAIAQPAGTTGCVSDDGSGPCADGTALFSPYGVAVSPDGKSVYASSVVSWAVTRFNRAP